MSEIELAPLTETLEEDEIKALGKQLEQLGAKLVPAQEDIRHVIAKRLSEEAMTEFMDRLEAHDLAADIFLPIEFEGRVTVGDHRFASANALVDVLEELKDELDVEDTEEYESDDEEDGEAEEEDDGEAEEEGAVIEAQLRHIWQLVSDACSEALEKNVPLYLRV
jgi:hypothetical protein